MADQTGTPPQDGDEIETAFAVLDEQRGTVRWPTEYGEALDSISRRLTEVSEERDRRVRQLDELESDYEDMRSRTNQETSSIHADMLALGRLLGVPYDGLKSPAGYLHADLMPVVRALTESRERVERLEAFAEWVRSLDEPEGWEERRSVTLTRIIERARNALSTPDSEDE
jgi:hypothetical protein